MPATSLHQIFAFEDNFQAAASSILTAAGLTPVITRGDPAAITDSVYIVRFTRGAATGDMSQIPSTAPSPINYRAEFTRFTGTLDIAVALPRPDNTVIAATPGIAREHGQRIGKVSAAFLRCQLPFTTSNLPFLDVSEIMPQQAEWGVDTEHDLDVCRLQWSVSFSIRADAWPVA